MFVKEGLLSVDNPIGAFCYKFANIEVATG